MNGKIRKILVANRGEIAVRIMHTAKNMGIQTVAVYAANEKQAFHVSYADEAYPLGEGTLNETYLNLTKLGTVIRQSGVDAVHPGYGSLSENPDFAELCVNNKVLFIGPDADMIRNLGDKIRSRELAESAGVGISKGFTGSPEEILAYRDSLDYPVLIKASAGGGGKGMQIAEKADRLKELLLTTARESENYFGSDRVYVEHYFRHPRHIEVQILGDHHGNLMHLFERECSLQRRHQKVIEEAPSPSVDADLRERLTDNALKLARRINYFSAGTVEFLVDKDNRIYFWEMNTRIQVEHPVTEKVTDIDIVREQIRIAEGQSLHYAQEDIQKHGHAIQARLYAEDPMKNYKPSPGFFHTIAFPENENIRIDHGLKFSDFINPDYDPMIAKVIAWGNDRLFATEKLSSFLQEATIIGQPTNQEFLREILNSSDFLNNQISTQYLEQETAKFIDRLKENKQAVSPISLIAAFVVTEMEYCFKSGADADIWQQIGFWRVRNRMNIEFEGKKYEVYWRKSGFGYQLQIEDSVITVAFVDKNQDEYIIEINNVKQKFEIVKQNSVDAVLKLKGYYYPIKRLDVLKTTDHEAEYRKSSNTQKSVVSPVHGRVVSIKVDNGSQIAVGDVLLVIESMKIENNIHAETDKEIEEIWVKEGEQVKDIQLLITLKNSEFVGKENPGQHN